MTQDTPHNPADEAAAVAASDWRAHPGVGRAVGFAKKAGYRIYRLSGEFLAIILGTALVWFLTLNVILAQRQVDVSFLSDNMALWFAQAFKGKSAEVGSIKLSWINSDNTIEVLSTDAVVRDESRLPLHEMAETRIALDLNALLRGRFETRRAAFTGGTLTWFREENGQVTAGLGTPETLNTFSPIISSRTESDAPADFGVLEELRFENGQIFIVDEKWQTSVKLEEAKVSILREDEIVNLDFDSIIADEGGAPGLFSGSFQIQDDFSRIDGEARLTNVDVHNIAPGQGPLAGLKSVSAPLSMTIGILRDDAQDEVRSEIELGAGELSLAGQSHAFKSLKLDALYNQRSNQVTATQAELQSERLSFAGAGSFALPQEDRILGYDLRVDEGRLDMSHIFDAPFEIERARFEGEFDLSNIILSVSDLLVDLGKFEILGRVNLDLNSLGGFEAVQGEGRVEGEFTHQELLLLWPSEFALGARDWIKRAVLSGQMSDITFDVDIPPEAIAERILQDEHLNLEFSAQDAQVRYISTMTPLEGVSGRGKMFGNSFIFDVEGGRVEGLNIESGQIEFPRLNPKGGDFTIDVQGRGPVLDMMRLIDQKPFEFATRYGVDANAFAGTGQVDMRITRPLLEFFDPERITYEVDGQFDNLKAPFSLGESRIEDGSVLLSADRNGMSLKGPVTLGSWDVDLNWREEFGENRGPTRIKLAGILDRDALDGFGIGLREYIGGSANIVIDAEGQGMDVSRADITADLTETELQMGEYWSKTPGAPGQLSATLSREIKQRFEVQDLTVDAPGLELRGGVNLNDQRQLLDFNVTEAKVDGLLDGTLRARPINEREQIEVIMDGDYLDISAFISRAIRAQRSEFVLPIRLEANINRLALSETYFVDKARVSFDHDGIGVRHLDVQGAHKGEPLVAMIQKSDDQGNRRLNIEVPDAALAAYGFLGMDNIRNGALSVSGTMPPAGEIGRLSGEVVVRDFKLIDAPVFARMLSMASLKGLTDLMGGEGVHFNKMTIPFTFEDGELSVRKAVAAGSALGMTGDGDVNFARKTVDVDGVLVPAYTANSMLGSIPVIGDIFVGKEGEGIFALSYAVKGPFSQTQISVNPLSALTPGFLRQIFDPVRKDKSVEEAPKTEEETNPPPG